MKLVQNSRFHYVYDNAINNGDLCTLKTSKKTQIIQKGGTITVRCRANVGIIRRKIPVLLEPDLSTSIPSDLELTQILLVLPKGKSPYVSIQINNASKHDIFLKGRAMLGMLQLVKFVTLFEVTVSTVKLKKIQRHYIMFRLILKIIQRRQV